MEYAVKFKNVTKEYKLYKNDKDRLKDLVWGKRYEPFRAVKDLSLNIKKGEIIGILGKNGSGKSTILKMVTGVVYPTKGSLEIEGRVSALLELTAGFDLELTGRENIYLKGYSMGLVDKQIDEKVEDIIDFSELGDYIEQPVRMYSSGMKARLGFAVAVNIDPDILVVDEALSVGDEIFRKKCLDKMDKFRDEGKTILFVSHSLPQVQSFCTTGVWLHQGELIAEGDIDEVCMLYRHYLNGVSVERIKSDMDKFKSFVEIAQSMQDVDVDVENKQVKLAGFVSVNPINKKGEIKEFILRDENKEYSFSEFTQEYNEDQNKINYVLKLPFDKVPTGKYKIEINIDVEDEMFTRELWCEAKVGKFIDKESNIEIIIIRNRLRIGKS